MDGRQITFLALLALVTVLARKSWRITAAMWFNAVLTLAAMHLVDIGEFSAQQGQVATGVADMLAATILICIGGRALIVALLFSLMAPSYLASIALGLSSYNAYWTAYLFGILQLIVAGAGSGSGGLGVSRRSFGGLAAYGLRDLRSNMASGKGGLSVGNSSVEARCGEL